MFVTSETDNNLIVGYFYLAGTYTVQGQKQPVKDVRAAGKKKKMRREGDTLENGCEKGRMRVYYNNNNNNNNNNDKSKISLRRNSENVQ